MAVRGCARVAGKAGENGQYSGAGRQLTLDKTVGSRVWRHTQGSSGRPASDLGWGSSSKAAPGSLSTGSPAGRTPPHGDGSMNSQANVRGGKVLRPPIRALAGSGWARGNVTPLKRVCFGWKGVRPWVRGEAGENPKNTSAASSSAPYPQESNSLWKKTIEEPLHMSTVEKSERPEQNRDLRCQSGPSAKDSVIFSGGDSSKNYGADQQRLQISDLHFDNFPTPATFACWKIRFKTEVCTCSQFPTEAVHWIKEVEMVDSVDDLMSSSSIRGIRMPDF